MLSGLERELNELRRLGTMTSLVVNKRRPLAGVIITTTTSVPAHILEVFLTPQNLQKLRPYNIRRSDQYKKKGKTFVVSGIDLWV